MILPLRRGDAPYLQKWIDQLRWQRLRPFEKLARMLSITSMAFLNYYRTKMPLGVEAVNDNIKTCYTSAAAI